MWWIKNVSNQWKLDKHRIATLFKKKNVSKGLYLTIVSFLSYVLYFWPFFKYGNVKNTYIEQRTEYQC